MKELKFNEEMQRAIDEGRKTEARGVLEVESGLYFSKAVKHNDEVYFQFEPSPINLDKDSKIVLAKCPYGKIGDINNGCLITDIRVEKLWDISEEGAIKEGVYRFYDNTFYSSRGVGAHLYRDYLSLTNEMLDAYSSFRTLWQSIYPNHPTKAWSLNPYVWVITFEPIKQIEQ